MERIAGKMPREATAIEAIYRDKYGDGCTIQAGPEGWTVIYSDGYMSLKDTVAETEINFNEAYNVASQMVGPLSTHPIELIIRGGAHFGPLLICFFIGLMLFK